MLSFLVQVGEFADLGYNVVRRFFSAMQMDPSAGSWTAYLEMKAAIAGSIRWLADPAKCAMRCFWADTVQAFIRRLIEWDATNARAAQIALAIIASTPLLSGLAASLTRTAATGGGGTRG
jgi:hypothetical protein